jgi:glycosyltransferase involved in cell wall biosynthesis
MEWDRDLRSRVQLEVMALGRLACCQRVIMVSDAARASYLAAWPARRDRVVTVHNGVAARPRPGSGRAVREELGIAPGDHVVTMITVLREGKGHGAAVEAVSAVRERFPAVRLLILGDGPAREEVRELAASLGDAAIVAGYRNDVMEVLDATDVLLHPSRVDAFPTALLEAMAAGVPVLASRVGGIPEIVDDGHSGVLVEAPPRAEPLARVLGDLLADPPRRRALAEAGRSRFEQRFTIEAWMRRLSAVYEAAIAGAPRPPGRPRRAGPRRAGSRSAP